MTTVIRTSALAVAALLMSSAIASAQNWGRPQTPQSGACFYEDVNYGGDYFCAPAGSNSAQVNYRLNNKISSIRLFGNAQVTVYVDQDFRGKSRTVGSDLTDLRRGGWNDRITSFRVRAAGPASGEWHGRWGRPSTPSAGACFYEHINFEGQYFCVREGDRVELVPEGTNDRISSIRLFGGAEISVFRDRDFSGASHHFEGDARDLRDSGWNDTISSFRVETSGYGRTNRGRGQGQGQNQGRGQGQGQGQSSGTVLGTTPGTGRLEWRGQVDGRIQLLVRGQSVEQRTITGSTLPNGRATFSSSMPAEALRVTASKLSGRGTVRIIQQPARANDFTAIIEIFDDDAGSQEYRIEVIWR